MTTKKTPNPPHLRLEWRAPEELAEHPENWKHHPEAQVEGLEAVISEVGWVLAEVAAGTVQREPQDESLATWEPSWRRSPLARQAEASPWRR